MKYGTRIMVFGLALFISAALSTAQRVFWDEPTVEAPLMPVLPHGPVGLYAQPGTVLMRNCYLENGRHAVRVTGNDPAEPCAIVVPMGVNIWLGDGHEFALGFEELGGAE